MDSHLRSLHFDVILQKLKEHALSQAARDTLDALRPYRNEAVCLQKMQETTAARAILESCGTPPLGMSDAVRSHVHHAQSGGMLTPAQLCEAARFASACKRTTEYLRRGEGCSPVCAQVGAYWRAFADLNPLRAQIEASVNEDTVFDDASPTLRSVRRKQLQQREQIKQKLEQILRSRKHMLADQFISVRGEHYVLPVLRRYRNEFGGTVIEASAKGGTLFIEPAAIRSMQEELDLLNLEEDTEVRRILYTLSGAVADAADAIHQNALLMETLDVLFAKAKLSALMNAREVQISAGRVLHIKGGRHPLLPADSCVPLDLAMDEENDGVIITGPNTGGKTVALKTVGLLCAMAQSGLHIPCDDGTVIPLHDHLLCDIGDSQSLSQNLSTFSGHITNVIHILNTASRDSLVLLDELGSGTDPAEGMGIAIAVLQELWLRKCRYMVTTHDPGVKDYAVHTPRVLAASMAFDRETLRPLYRLETGRTGESCALHIAQRLGMPDALLQRAHQVVYGGGAIDPEHLKPAIHQPPTLLVRQKAKPAAFHPFSIGDAVHLPNGESGIVYRPANERGDVIVQVKEEKRIYNHKRVKLHIPAAELYPPDYDFSILFDTVANRKAAHVLNKRYDESAVILHTKGKEE